MPTPRPHSRLPVALALAAFAAAGVHPSALAAQPAAADDEAAVRAALEHYLAGHATGEGANPWNEADTAALTVEISGTAMPCFH